MVGVDEVGRGSLAGPLLVVAARAKADLPRGIKDSKLLSKRQRQTLINLLYAACDYGEGWVSCGEIDRLGLAHAMRLGVRRALHDLSVTASESIIIDGPVNYAPKKFKNAQAVIDADNDELIVSAASIIAKVKRDNYMEQLAKLYPNYYLETNVGYGTPQHLAALQSFGPQELVHRMSFAPLRQASLW